MCRLNAKTPGSRLNFFLFKKSSSCNDKIYMRLITQPAIPLHPYHHQSVMELGHLLTRSGLMYPEVSPLDVTKYRYFSYYTFVIIPFYTNTFV